MACKICEKRKPRRYCPGVLGDICSICCGTEREVSVTCPLECPYLREAHQYERKPDIDPDEFPNAEIRISEEFLRQNEALLVILASSIAETAIAEKLIDRDLKDALDSLVRTYKTLQSGIVFDSRPENPYAARVYGTVQERVEDLRKRLAEHSRTLRDADVLGILAFLQRLEIQHNNGRPKSRAFVDFLRQFFPGMPKQDGPLLVS